jgi:hypothetical protein
MIGLGLALFPVLYPLRGTAALEPVAILCAGLATVAALYLFYWLLGAFTPARRTAAWVAATVMLATPVWPYASTLFMEPFLLLCTTGACAFVLRQQRGLVSGAFVGWAILLKPTMALLLLPLAFGLRRNPRQLALLGLAPAAAVLLTLYLNLHWFGGAWRAQQPFPMGNPLRGALGLLFDPAHGLLLTAPIALLAVAAWPTFLRAQPEALVLAVAFALHFVLVALLLKWGGGTCYGPRYLVPVLTLLLAPLVEWGPEGVFSRRWPRWSGRLALGMVLVSLSINLPPAFGSQRAWGRHPYQAMVEMLADARAR